jgi:tetratricopeptide (TPR) repeat protein
MRFRSAVRIAALAIWIPALAGLATSAESPAAVFNEGNAHFQNGDFAAAERCYRQILERGVESGALYYNLGNACFKQKKLGEAIYYWEKARRIMPGDSDVAENLQFANLLVVDQIEVPEDPLPVRILDQAVHFFTAAQESGFILLLFIAANALFSIYLLIMGPRVAYWAVTACIATLLLTLLFGASLAWKVYQENHNRQGVIVEQKVEIRSGPSAENITVVTVHEGIIVQVRRQSSSWYQISLPNGWTGWLPSSSIRIL